MNIVRSAIERARDVGRSKALERNKTTKLCQWVSLTYLWKTTVRTYMINGTRTVIYVVLYIKTHYSKMSITLTFTNSTSIDCLRINIWNIKWRCCPAATTTLYWPCDTTLLFIFILKKYIFGLLIWVLGLNSIKTFSFQYLLVIPFSKIRFNGANPITGSENDQSENVNF